MIMVHQDKFNQCHKLLRCSIMYLIAWTDSLGVQLPFIMGDSCNFINTFQILGNNMGPTVERIEYLNIKTTQVHDMSFREKEEEK